MRLICNWICPCSMKRRRDAIRRRGIAFSSSLRASQRFSTDQVTATNRLYLATRVRYTPKRQAMAPSYHLVTSIFRPCHLDGRDALTAGSVSVNLDLRSVLQG